MIEKYCSSTFLIIGLWLAMAPWAASQTTATFDFDNGSPVLSRGQNTPVDQTAGGILARFSSPSGAAFSVQSDASTGWRMSRFSGNYLYDNDLTRSVLSIKFSQPLSSISLTFATGDFEIEVPSALELTAYLDSNATPAVGQTSARGTYAGDTMPTGTMTFDSGGRPFDLVELTVPLQPNGATVFLVDNIKVTAMSGFATVSAASYAIGGALAPGSIASGFGQGLASGEEAATSVPLPTTLANTTVTVTDSAGVDRQARLWYAGPTQVNYMVPEGTAPGAATVKVTSGGRMTATVAVRIDPVAPGIFTANWDGKGAPAAAAITVTLDQTQTVQAVAACGTSLGSCVTSPIDLGPSGTQVILTLYGTGIRGRSSQAGVTAQIGGVKAEVQYAGAQPEFAGLDQVNVAIPRTLAGRGEVDLILTVEGKAANTVRVNIN